MESQLRNLVCDLLLFLSAILVSGVKAWQVKSMEELFVMFVVILLLDLKIKFWKVSPSSLLPALLFGFVS
ncbi:hypothetical protein Peur_037884 [Populus x canadensis]